MTNTSKNLVLSSAFLVLGVAITWETFNYGDKSSVFLRILSITLTLMALAYLVTNLVRKQIATQTSETSPSLLARHGNALMIFALVGGYVAAMQVVGFLLSTMLFGYVAQVAIARRHRNLYIVYSILMALSIYLIFFTLLGIAVPESLLSLDQSLKFL